ncbi:MAG: BamA/TamA family outer membrane protein [Planctomycetes bacterium]|nr:BamA/TamA family outer membrane protein [Planctomycetota bacterium]
MSRDGAMPDGGRTGRRGPRARRRVAGLALAWLAAACSVLEPTYTADSPGPSGRIPVGVDVDLVGNQGLAGPLLRRRIEDYMLDLSRDPTREAAAYDAALEVEDFYRAQGYPLAKVRYDYTAPDADADWPARVRVRLLVEEGPLVTVAMALHGNSAHGDDELLALWSRRRIGLLAFGGVAFVEAEVYAFADQLRTFYRTRGRLDTIVHPPEIDLDLERGVAAVGIRIDEGEVHTIGAVDVAPAFREALGGALPPPPVGKPCADSEIFGYRDAVRLALRHAGHPEPRVAVAAEAQPHEARRWTVRVTGDPGPVATVGTVAVAGNRKTMAGVILGKLDLAAGDRYDGTAVDEALRRLYRLGLFRKVEIAERTQDGDPERLDLEIQVEEADSRAVEFLAGYGSYERLRAGLRLSDSNVLGTGRGLALDNRISMRGYATQLTASDPDFFGTGSTLTLSGEVYRREEPSFVDEALGGTLALSRVLREGLLARVGYQYRNHFDSNAFTALPQDQFVDFAEGKVFVEVRHDRRDNVLFPRRGHSQSLLFERLAPSLGADVDLDRLTLRAIGHVPLSSAVGLVLRSEQSVLWPHQGSANVPLQKRWFNGGENTVRSYRESQLGPKDAAGSPIGGEYRNIFSVELRFALLETLEAGLFADAGNVGAEIQDFSLDDMRYGLGGGLRLLLPIGPVRLDAAWNPDRDPGDKVWVVHFSVGYPF